jgi:hypothetical protein
VLTITDSVRPGAPVEQAYVAEIAAASRSGAVKDLARRNPMSSIFAVGLLRRLTPARTLQGSSYQPPPRITR